MNPHKAMGREAVFHFLHRQQHNEGLGLMVEVYFQVFAHAFDVANVGNVDAHHLVLGFQEHGIIAVDG